MKKSIKKATAVLLAVIMVLSVFTIIPFYVSATEIETEAVSAKSGTTGECTWTLDENGTLTISGNGAMQNYSIIQDYNDYYYTTYITNAPWGSKIKTVIIEDGVTKIGSCSFYNCKALISVTISGNVTSIGSSAFSGCTGLTSITIPNSVRIIDENGFSDCTRLTSVNMPNSLTSIGASAFSNCTGLTSVNMPNSLTSIGASAFSDCTGLTNITIPDGVANVGRAAFNGTAWYSTWYNEQPDESIIYIGKTAYEFKGTRYSGGSIIIKDGTKSITSYAFYFSPLLHSVKIPDSVTRIGENAFRSLISGNLLIVCNPGSCAEAYAKNYSFRTSTTGECTWSIDNDTLTISGNGKMCDYSYTCNYLNYHEGNQCPTITDAPWSNYSFKNVVIEDGVTYIGKYAFTGCSDLKSVTISNSVTSMGEYVFSECNDLTSVTIGKGVTSIGNCAFKRCTGLTSVNISDIAAWCNISFSDSDSNPLYYAQKLYLNNELVTDLVIPDSVTSINDYAFTNCTGLTSVNIENGVTSIGNCAFNCCTGLISVTIPDSVMSIGCSAFSGCNGLTSITIPNSVICIDYSVFFDCTGLKSVYIPASVTNIDDDAFACCTSLSSINIPASVTSIGEYAFGNCISLKNIVIPSSVTSIGEYAFGYLYGTMDRIEDFIIYGYRGSEAEKYAAENDFVFIALDTESSIQLGDINQNGTVEIQDVTALQRHLAEFTNSDGSPIVDEENEEVFKIADVNHDGSISIADITMIQRYLAEFIDSFG